MREFVGIIERGKAILDYFWHLILNRSIFGVFYCFPHAIKLRLTEHFALFIFPFLIFCTGGVKPAGHTETHSVIDMRSVMKLTTFRNNNNNNLYLYSTILSNLYVRIPCNGAYHTVQLVLQPLGPIYTSHLGRVES